jgi:hypothetical protein
MLRARFALTEASQRVTQMILGHRPIERSFKVFQHAPCEAAPEGHGGLGLVSLHLHAYCRVRDAILNCKMRTLLRPAGDVLIRA